MPSTVLPSTPNSVTSLRQYWRNRDKFPEPADLAGELHGESDRATVILMAAMLDDALAFRLTDCLALTVSKKEKDHIFRPGGPLGSFSSRAEVAYLFGFIDARIRGQLDDVREMRNACAHSKQSLTFATPELANVAKRLCKPRGVFHLSEETPAGIRASFLTESLFVHLVLAHGDRKTALAQLHGAYQELLASLAP